MLTLRWLYVFLATDTICVRSYCHNCRQLGLFVQYNKAKTPSNINKTMTLGNVKSIYKIVVLG